MHPILFKIGPMTVYSYGFFVALGCIVGCSLILRDCTRYSIPRDKAWDLLFYIFISGLIGARLLHVILNLAYYRSEPLEILMLHKGGLAIQGGIIAAITVGVIFILKKGLPFWKAGDLIAQYLALGQAIGRIGCFLNGCCYGRITRSFTGLGFPGEPWLRYPIQIYLSAGFLAIFIILRYLSEKNRPFDGGIFLLYFLLYTPLRFFTDFLREDLRKVFFGLTVSQTIGLALFLTALVLYIIKKRGSMREEPYPGNRG